MFAVVLAVLAAVLFGLAAVRQHRSVQETMAVGAKGLRHQLASFSRLVRQPNWLVGSCQAVLAGGLHILALALAPIALVQPIGVLAVPVTVVGSAVRAGRRPSRSQGVGSVLSVTGVVLLTLLLLTPTTSALVLPSRTALGVTVGVAAVAAVLVIRTGGTRRPLLRCVTLAATAACLFGINSILIRTIGHSVASGSLAANRWVLITAALGIAVALPVGLWAMQTAYLSGSPHVVICCLTLIDPLAAVTGGNLLLHDGMQMMPFAIVAGVACALLAAWGVVFLAKDYPVHIPEPALDGTAEAPLASPLVHP